MARTGDAAVIRLENLLINRRPKWTTSMEIAELIGTPCASTRISDLRERLIKQQSPLEIESETVILPGGARYGKYRIRIKQVQQELPI